ncbi:MAG: nitroreductase family protein [Candidatus Hodarchaeota archaeon]
MFFSKPITEIIRERTSRRTYSPKPIEKDKEKYLKELLTLKSFSSPFSKIAGKCRFELIGMPEFEPNEKRRLGTYGLISGAQEFIVGATIESKYNLENYGYLLEAIILAATDTGLSTCWLGGFFNRSLFSTKINCQPNEVVPAISPIGYAPENYSFKEKAIRRFAKANERFQWDKLFFNDNFSVPLKQEQTGNYTPLLEMVRLGPSAGNKQPWRIVKESATNIYHFYVKSSKDKFGIKYNMFVRLDIGIAICHFDLTASELEIGGCWEFLQPEINEIEGVNYVISWNGSS